MYNIIFYYSHHDFTFTGATLKAFVSISFAERIFLSRNYPLFRRQSAQNENEQSVRRFFRILKITDNSFMSRAGPRSGIRALMAQKEKTYRPNAAPPIILS